MIRVTISVFSRSIILVHMNLTNYIFITDSIMVISTTCSLLALYFMHEIREIADVRFMPEISLHKRLTLNSTHGHESKKLQLSYDYYVW